MDLLDPVYIVRDAAFGSDFTPKLFTAIAAIALVIWDWLRQRRLDYVWVFLFGTVIWGGVEAFLKLQGIRDMPERTLFDQPLSLPASYLLQGMSEGAFIAVIGLFLGDRWLCRATRRTSVIVGVVAIVVIALATFRSSRRLPGFGDAASRRNILDETAVIALLVMVAIGVIFFIVYRTWRPRTVAMFVMMVIVATGWTLAQTSVQGRWVELPGPTAGTFAEAGPIISFLALAFDVLIEIAGAYVPFLAIPVMLNLIRNPDPIPRPPQSKTEAVRSVGADISGS